MSDTNPLVKFSTDELAAEIRRRVREDEKLRSFWPDEVFSLVTDIAAIPCVDCLLVRPGEGVPDLGFSIRNTGYYTGKLWMAAGGKINRGESFSGALKRHIKTDLGLEVVLASGLGWNMPILTAQHGPKAFPGLADGEFAGDERSKFCTSNTYLVVAKDERVVLGSKVGGQESAGLVWYPADALPPDEEIAYGGAETIRQLAAWALLHLRG